MHIFIRTGELPITTATSTNEVHGETEMQSVIFETKISNCSTIYVKFMSFCTFHSLSHHALFHLKYDFFSHKFFKSKHET